MIHLVTKSDRLAGRKQEFKITSPAGWVVAVAYSERDAEIIKAALDADSEARAGAAVGQGGTSAQAPIALTERDRELLRIAANWCDGTVNFSDPGPLAHAAALIRRLADAPSAPVGIVLTAEEREWLEYAVELIFDSTGPEDATCGKGGKVLGALLDRASALTPPAAAPRVEPRA